MPRRTSGALLRLRRLAPVLALTGLLAACSSSEGAQVAVSTPSGTPSASQSETASPTPKPPDATSPLSGRKGGVGTPVIVVKYDNTPSAQPHVGLTSADVVYVEPVEWGLTRLAARFSSSVPAAAGPVRSARISDIDMLAPYGDVAFVFSGAQKRLWPHLKAADWTPLSEDLASRGFYRERSRSAPFNLMAQPRAMLAANQDVAVAQDMGLVFDQDAPKGGRRATTVSATWPNSSVQFRWNASARAYDVWMNGRPARATEAPGVQRASTVIVQYLDEHDSGYGDKFGGTTPMAETVGKGSGLVVRDGRAYPITWSRAHKSDPTEYLDASRGPMPLDPGQVWILLKDRTKKVTVLPAAKPRVKPSASATSVAR
jgi:hypothetical protein